MPHYLLVTKGPKPRVRVEEDPSNVIRLLAGGQGWKAFAVGVNPAGHPVLGEAAVLDEGSTSADVVEYNLLVGGSPDSVGKAQVRSDRPNRA